MIKKYLLSVFTVLIAIVLCACQSTSQTHEKKAKEDFLNVVGFILFSKAPVTLATLQSFCGSSSIRILTHLKSIISYDVNIVSQFIQNPSEDNMNAMIRIIYYLKSAPGRGLMFSKNDHLYVEGYTNTDWAGSVSDRKSTSRYFTFIRGNLVTRRSKKRKVVALSSAEAEFQGMVKGLCELLQIKRLLSQIGFGKATIEISYNPIQHDCTKYIEVDRHFIKQNLKEGVIKFPFVQSEDQLADVLTKAVSSKDFHSSLIKFGIEDIFAPT